MLDVLRQILSAAVRSTSTTRRAVCIPTANIAHSHRRHGNAKSLQFFRSYALSCVARPSGSAKPK